MMMPDMNMEQLKQQMSQMNMDAMGHQMPPGYPGARALKIQTVIFHAHCSVPAPKARRNMRLLPRPSLCERSASHSAADTGLA